MYRLTRTVALSAIAALAITGCDSTNMGAYANMGTQIASQVLLQNPQQMTTGIKSMLDLSSQRASQALSTAHVWNLVLPPQALKMTDTMRMLGMGKYVDNVQTSMDKAAAQAAVAAAPVFKQAISNMTITDALKIVSGGEHAATEYFKRQTEASLRNKFSPIVDNALQQVQFYDTYKTTLAMYNALPLSSKPNLDIQSYMLDRTLNQLFSQMAIQEATIRRNPQAVGNAAIAALFAGKP